MVHLLTVGNLFQARVIAGRLGAEGVVTQLRGAVDGPYPVGNVFVFVDEEDADLARQLLLADEVEAVFDDVDGGGDAPRGLRSRSLIALSATTAVLVLVAVGDSLLRLSTP